MHNFDRVLNQNETYGEAAYGNEVPTFNEFESGYTGEAYQGEGEDEQQNSLAAELLTLQSEEELEQFFGKVFSTVARGAMNFARSPAGKIIGGALRQAAKQALPSLGTALGSMIPIPGVGTALGSWAGKTIANRLELEASSVSNEDREFAAARNIVGVAQNAARSAMSAGGGNPNAIASSAIRSAMNGIGGSIGSGPLPRSHQGRWVRRGNTIMLLGI
jgi:hypothetical protein